MTPDTALAAVLATAGVGTVDTSIFVGPEKAQDASRFPAASVFVFASGGPAPQPYIGTSTQCLFRARVSVVCRGEAQDYQGSLTKARAVITAGNRATVTGYISCLALDSEPIWLGYNDQMQPRWLVSFLMEIQQ